MRTELETLEPAIILVVITTTTSSSSSSSHSCYILDVVGGEWDSLLLPIGAYWTG